jgi:hypothetical protein
VVKERDLVQEHLHLHVELHLTPPPLCCAAPWWMNCDRVLMGGRG